mgnify:CR=1 FL=1
MSRTSKMTRLLRWLPLLLACAGGAAGYLYYRLVGCPAGTCPISSHPLSSVLYCAAVGALLGTALQPAKTKTDRKPETEDETNA